MENQEDSTGNYAIFLGNWGDRGSALNRGSEIIARRQAHDQQVLKNPAHVIVLCEANHVVEEMLRRPKRRRSEPSSYEEDEEDDEDPAAVAAKRPSVKPKSEDIQFPKGKRHGSALSERAKQVHHVVRGTETIRHHCSLEQKKLSPKASHVCTLNLS